MEFVCVGTDKGETGRKQNSSLYKIISDEGQTLATVRNVTTWVGFTPRSLWRVDWIDQPSVLEQFRNLHEIHLKYNFSNYPGPYKVLRDRTLERATKPQKGRYRGTYTSYMH